MVVSQIANKEASQHGTITLRHCPLLVFILSIDSWKQFSGTLKTAGHDLVPVQPNLIDKVWGQERPDPPADEVFVQPMKYSGK